MISSSNYINSCCNISAIPGELHHLNNSNLHIKCILVRISTIQVWRVIWKTWCIVWGPEMYFCIAPSCRDSHIWKILLQPPPVRLPSANWHARHPSWHIYQWTRSVSISKCRSSIPTADVSPWQPLQYVAAVQLTKEVCTWRPNLFHNHYAIENRCTKLNGVLLFFKGVYIIVLFSE